MSVCFYCFLFAYEINCPVICIGFVCLDSDMLSIYYCIILPENVENSLIFQNALKMGESLGCVILRDVWKLFLTHSISSYF